MLQVRQVTIKIIEELLTPREFLVRLKWEMFICRGSKCETIVSFSRATFILFF